MSMPRRLSEPRVTSFLRDALADEALGVAKLDAMARSAGLLDEGQDIAQAKVFRRAKRSLGIRSVRDGFGAGGGWLWELPRDPENRAPPPSPIAPQPVRKDQLVPREWVEGVARLEQHRPPPDIPRHRWCQFVEDCHAFVASNQLANRTAELGWDATALFGCQRNHPLSYLGRAGLLWHVQGDRVVELHRTWAVISRRVNKSQQVFYRRDVDGQKIALPWTLPLVKTG
jgi:hypothetical protein